MKLNLALCGVLLATGSLAFAQSSDLPSQAVLENPEYINRHHQREWVRLTDDGKILGRVAVIEPAGTLSGRIDNQVVLSLDGKVVYSTKTAKDGWFEIQGWNLGRMPCRSSATIPSLPAVHILPADAGICLAV